MHQLFLVPVATEDQTLMLAYSPSAVHTDIWGSVHFIPSTGQYRSILFIIMRLQLAIPTMFVYTVLKVSYNQFIHMVTIFSCSVGDYWIDMIAIGIYLSDFTEYCREDLQCYREIILITLGRTVSEITLISLKYMYVQVLVYLSTQALTQSKQDTTCWDIYSNNISCSFLPP